VDAIRLAKLLITETSSVDDPANELPGWIVQKAAGTGPTAPIVAKIRDLILGAPLEGKDDIEMDAAELTAILDERIEKALAANADAVAKTVEPAPTGEVAPVVVPATEVAPATEPVAIAPGLTAEDVTKGVKEAIEPLLEVIDKALDRIENVETALGYAARKSIEGQETNEGAEGEDKTPDLADAIAKAFRHPASRR
jgi:hypothetical protein